jgi:hypothetical protein
MPILGVVASSISGHLTPPFTPTGSYDALASYTVPSGGLASITFSAIPSTYTHLQVRFLAQDTRSTYWVGDMYMRFNNSSTGYAFHLLTGNGSIAFADKGTNYTEIYVGSGSIGTTTGGTFGVGVMDILDYASTSKYKVSRTLVGDDHNGTGGGGSLGGRITLASGLWQSTNAINQITFYGGNGNLAEFSQLALYGIRG